MKNGPLPLPTVVVLFLLSSVLLSCGQDYDPPLVAIRSSVHLVSLAITPPAPSMAPGSRVQLDAIGAFSTGSSHKVTDVSWSSADQSAAMVDSAGLVTAVSGTGSVVITATTGSIAASTTVTISPLATMSIQPQNDSLAPGTSRQFTATGILANSARQDLTTQSVWKSSPPGIVTVSGTGFATTATGTTGTATISATFSGITGTSSLSAAAVTSLVVVPGDATIVRGTTLQFRAKGTLSNGITQDLTKEVQWTVSPPQTASISGTGLAVGNAAGTAVITAAFGNIPGSAILKVTEPVLTKIHIAPVSMNVSAGTPVQFTALGTFTDNSQQDITENVTWMSSDTAIATVGNAPGTKGLASTLAFGTVRITASRSGINSDQAVLTVSGQTGTGGQVSLTPLNPMVPVGTSVQFSLTRRSPDGTLLEDLTSSAVWTSSNSSVATVSQGQTFTFTPGTTVISASTGTTSVNTILTVTFF